MVICKHFLQGTCRFGENCKFEHQLNDHTYGPTYASKPSQSTANVDTNTLVKSVVTDMTAAEKGGQWLLSSYAPFKEKPAFPGFEDHSMEEIRHMFYEAMRSGNMEQYKQNLQIMLQQAVVRIRALQMPSPDAVNMLKVIYHTSPLNQADSVFGSTAQQNPPFGNNPTTAQQNPPFGNNPTTAQNIFGNSNNTSTSGNNMFGNNPTFSAGVLQQPSLFFNQTGQIGSFNQQQTSSPFNQNVFQQQTQNSVDMFEGTNLVVPQPPHLVVPQPPHLVVPQPPHLVVPQPPPNQLNPPLKSVQATENKPSVQHSTNIFGNLTSTTKPAQSKPNEKFYSKLEDLSEDDIRWFQSDDTDISKIPLKPPTYEMCFPLK